MEYLDRYHLWLRISAKIKTISHLAVATSLLQEAIFILKMATDLINDSPVLVTERSTMAIEKTT